MSEFIVYPAIDLRGGQVVRLKQGDPDFQTTYDRHPGGVACRWLTSGARWLHVVNLDGAFEEDKGPNLGGLRQILRETRQSGAKVQFGGGIRTSNDIEKTLSLGVKRVILGTAAAQNPDLVQEAVTQFSARAVAVGVDVRDGAVQVKGWSESTDLDPIPFGRLLKEKGLKWAIFTDIQRDGVGRGLNVQAARDFQEQSDLKVIASGGVRSLDDVREARQAGLAGVIIGRALYEEDVNLAEALDIAKGEW